jgi:protoporphyrinogen/coproporphyrinogen III oxidase
MNNKKKIAIIGAGPAGASAAYYLQKEGYEVIVFEKENFIGGRTHGYNDGEIGFDTGASFFTNFYPLLKELVKKLDLENEVIELERRVGLRYKDVLAEFTFGDLKTFWRLPFITTKDKLIMIWTTIKLTLKRKNLDLVSPEKLSKYDDSSIADWATNTMSENVYQYLIRPGVEPFWYFSCDEVSRAMTTVLQGRAADAKFYTFKRGMAQISERLLANVQLNLSSTVNQLSKKENKIEISYIKENVESTIEVDKVIVATPTNAFKNISHNFKIEEVMSDFINTQKYVSNVHATYTVNEEAVKDMFAYYYPCGNWKTPIGAIVLHKQKCINSVKVPKGKELISVFILDKPSKELMKIDNDEEIFNRVWEMATNFESKLPIDAKPVALYKRKNAIPLHEVGRYKTANKIKNQENKDLVFAGDYLSCATVEGALRSGRWAASQISGKKITF